MTAPARFDRADQQRRIMIAKVKIAMKQIGMADDSYRALLLRVAGKSSAADCTMAELARVIDEMTRMGFRPAPPKSGGRAAADHPSADKARALWISLWHLGAIADSSEPALEAFATRQLGVDRLQWADQTQSYKLIEALKAIGARHGWRVSGFGLKGADAVIMMKRDLVRAIMVKLRKDALVPASWDALRAAREFGASTLLAPDAASNWHALDAAQLDNVATVLGARLRAARADQGGSE